MKVRCLIIEDEPLAQKLMTNHISKMEDLKLIKVFSNALDAASYIRSNSVDLLFLDIQMPELTGLQLIKSIKNPPAVIFTTAFRNYAPDAFDLDVIDYLLKPISFERFMMAVNKYFERGSPGIKFRTQGITETGNDFIYIRSDRKTVKIWHSQIRYVESLDDYVKVHTIDSVFITRENISNLEKSLQDGFVRIHRSYLINIHFVTAFSGESVFLNKLELPFGRAFKRSALECISRSERN